MTHRDGFTEFSARQLMRRDAIHHKHRLTPPESSVKPPFRSLVGGFGVRQQALTMNGIACGLFPTRTLPQAIPMGHYPRSLV